MLHLKMNVLAALKKKFMHWRTLETKQDCDDDAAAQLFSQMHDYLLARLELERLLG